MRIVMLVNPVAGAGRAPRVADALAGALRADGHEVDVAPTRAEDGRPLRARLEGAGLLVVAGGDGTVRGAVEDAVAADVPLYQVPFGTENLFAREFGMAGRIETLRAAIARQDVRRVDLGLANGAPFLLMASMGYDAEVVDDLARHRGESISHLSYAMPMARRALAWRAPRLRISVDGAEAAAPYRGGVLVGNSRQYGMRLDPARHAEVDDGLLDVVTIRARSVAGVAAFALRARLRALGNGAVRGRRIEIEADSPCHVQLDGDPAHRPGDDGDGGTVRRLEIAVRPGVVPVLVP